jgi:hypothetical protein
VYRGRDRDGDGDVIKRKIDVRQGKHQHSTNITTLSSHLHASRKSQYKQNTSEGSSATASRARSALIVGVGCWLLVVGCWLFVAGGEGNKCLVFVFFVTCR